MKKFLASALALTLLASFFTIPAAAKEAEVVLSEQYGRLSIQQVISQRTLPTENGALVVYTVAAGGTLNQAPQLGYCYKIDRRLAVEENGGIRDTDAPNLEWDLDILDPNLPIEPFAYTMNAGNEPGFLHIFEVEVRGHTTTRFGLVLDPNAVPKTTRYQSTAELTNVCIADMDYDDVTLTVTNPTDGRDSGTIAVVLASQKATVHFVDYDLAPKESKDYHIVVSGHVGVGVNEKMVLLDKGWGAYLNADIITFDSDADRDTYRAAVVYEKNIDLNVTQGTDKNANVVICNGQPGDTWLKNYTGIGRHDKPHLDPAVSHDRCKR